MNKFMGMAALAAVALSACGGGGGGTASPPSPALIAKAEGVYSGGTNLTGGPSGLFSVAILEDDSAWAIYGVAGVGGSMIVQGFVNGAGVSNNGSYTASGKDYVNNGTVANSSITATYVPGVSFSGSAGVGSSFSGTTAAATGYTYNAPFPLASLAGTWTGSSISGQAVTMSISGNGNYTVTSGGVGGCPGSGTITPRASGKNIANVTYTYNSPSCFPASLSASGVVILTTLSTGRLQLIGLLTTADKSIGSAIFVTK